METVKEKEKNYLENKVIVCKPIVEKFNPDFTAIDKDHKGRFRFPHCAATIMLRLDEQSRGLKQILNEDEQAFFEKKMNMKPGQLSFYRTSTNKDDHEHYNFWYGYQVRLEEEFETKFNLADPLQNLAWRILKVDRQVAPSYEERLDKPSYKWYLEDETAYIRVNNTLAEMKSKAFIEFDKVRNDKNKLLIILKNLGKVFDNSTQIELLQAELYKIIETPLSVSGVNLKDFLAVIQDNNSRVKAFINDAKRFGEIKIVKGKYYTTGNSDPIAISLEGCVEYFNDPENQELYKLMEEKIKNKS